jgi:hypothetical protein
VPGLRPRPRRDAGAGPRVPGGHGLDLSAASAGADPRPGDEFLASEAEARAWIAGQPAKSVLSVFDATGAVYNLEVVNVLKDFAKHNEPFMKASTVVGVEGLLNLALTAVSRFTGRTFKTFKDRQSAMDWLVGQ